MDKRERTTSREREPVTFAAMARSEKFVFVLKLAICIISFGFLYPNIMHD